VTRTEYSAAITALADNFNGTRRNSPNDIVCQSNGAIWFIDPSFGTGDYWEGLPAEMEVSHAVYRIAPEDGRLAGNHRPRRAERTGVLAGREDSLCGGKPRDAAPADLGVRRRCREPAVEQAHRSRCQLD